MPHTPSPVSTPFPYTTLFRSLLKIRTERFLHRQRLVRPGGYALSLVCQFMSFIQGVLPVLAGDEQLRLVAGPVAQDAGVVAGGEQAVLLLISEVHKLAEIRDELLGDLVLLLQIMDLLLMVAIAEAHDLHEAPPAVAAEAGAGLLVDLKDASQ